MIAPKFGGFFMGHIRSRCCARFATLARSRMNLQEPFKHLNPPLIALHSPPWFCRLSFRPQAAYARELPHNLRANMQKTHVVTTLAGRKPAR